MGRVNQDTKGAKTIARVARSVVGVLTVVSALHAFAASARGQITIDEFPLAQNAAPLGITSGADGNVWFTEFGLNQVAKINPSGTPIQGFSIPTPGSGPGNATLGPDGNVWFVEQLGNRIGRVTPGGTVSDFLIPTAASNPFSIV